MHAERTLFAMVVAVVNLAAPPGSAEPSFPVVDTGQQACYSASAQIECPAAGEAFAGQDAQHTGSPPHYTDNGDGTVTDEVTGLMWQRSPDLDGDGDIDADDKRTYDEALAGADGFALAGHHDWRLPTITELYSLIDFSGVDPTSFEGVGGARPFIDTSAFDFAYGDTSAGERIIDAQFASSTLYVSTTMGGNRTMFGVNFADGRIKGYPADGKGFYVLHVRGGSEYGVNRFVDNGDGTVTDDATGLMWAREDSGVGMDWEDALAWVAERNAEGFLGHDDWRLPDAKELQSLVDYSRSPDTTGSAAIDPVFEATAITNEAGRNDFPFYWSSTTHARDMTRPGEAAVYVAFGRALGYMHGRWLDVHGAGAQRSDPKQGDPSDFPYGRGPQGDAIRILNFVRPVRTVTETDTAPSSPDVVVPAVARVEGAGAFFSSRVDLFNAGEAPMTVDVVYTPRQDVGGDARRSVLTLAPRRMETVDDPLGRWLDLGDDTAAVGSLMLTVTEGSPTDLLVQSVVTATLPDGSEYGQLLPGVTPEDVLPAGTRAWLSGPVDAERTRMNLGVVGLADGTRLTVQPANPVGGPLARAATLELDLGQSVQLNDLDSAFALKGADGWVVSVEVEAGRAVVYGSLVDGTTSHPGTSDPTTVLPVRAGAATVTLLELGSIQGVDEFAGSASLTNLSGEEIEARAELFRRDEPGVAMATSVRLAAGETLASRDLLGDLFATGGVGAVVLRASGGGALMATGREYSIARGEDGAVVGTAGQRIPGMTDADLLRPDRTYHLLGLRQRELTRGVERTHLAVFNPGVEPVHVRLEMVDGATGAVEGSAELDVAASELVRVNGVLDVLHPAQDGEPKRLEVRVDGPVLVAALRANADGDPYTIEALHP